MSLTYPETVFPNVPRYSDGMPLDETTMNAPIEALARRTDFLETKLSQIAGEHLFSSNRIPDVEFSDGVGDYDCVYLKDTGLYDKAKASVLVSSNPFEISGEASFAVGIAVPVTQEISETHTGTVVLSGLVNLKWSDVRGMLEPGEEFRTGPYYLSARTPGKITANPVGPTIFIGVFVSDKIDTDGPAPHGTYALIAPQYKDLAEMHHHRSFALSTNDNTQGIKDNGSMSNLSVFVGGTYVGTAVEQYVFRVVSKSTSNGSDTYSVYSGTSTAWSSLYVEWYEVTSQKTGYSPIEYDSATITFAIGDKGLVCTASTANIPDDDNLTPSVAVRGYQFGTCQGWGDDVTTPAFTSESVKGWYSTGDATFNYAYPVGLDPDLNKFFPPFPSSGCSLVKDGTERSSAALYGDSAVFKITNTAILWSSGHAGNEVPFVQGNVTPVVTFHLSRGKLPSSSFVTSLKAAEGSGITIREEGTADPASTGNLVIDGQIPIERTDPGLSGYLVPKDVQRNRLLFGPVVSSLRVGPGLVRTSRTGQPDGFGDVTIALDGQGMSGAFDEIVLHNAKQELVRSFPYIKLLGSGDVATSFTLKMHVPISVPVSASRYNLVFCFSLFGLEDRDGTPASEHAWNAAFSIQAEIMQDWYKGAPEDEYRHTLLDNCVLVPDAETGPRTVSVPIGFASTNNTYAEGASLAYKKFDTVFVHNGWADFGNGNNASRYFQIGDLDIGPLQPNSSIAITIARAAALENNYTSPIGFTNMSWKLVERAE